MEQENIVFNKIYDMERFLPHSVEHPDLIERLMKHEKQDYKTSLSTEDFAALPVLSNYKATRLTEEEILELRRINDAKLAEQQELEDQKKANESQLDFELGDEKVKYLVTEIPNGQELDIN